MLRIMVDADLVLEYILYREEAVNLGDIIERQDIDAFMTDIGLDKILSIASKINNPQETIAAVQELKQWFEVCHTDADLIQQANSLIICKE